MRLMSVFFFAVIFATVARAEAPRWNILFVFADDWGRYASCYKGLDGRADLNDVIKTPHIDRIAKEGTIFKNAFVNAPSCTPCRSSLLSGRYFFNCQRGAILNGAVWDSSIPTFPLMLLDSGYRSGKRQFRRLPRGPSARQTLALLLRADHDASHVDQGLRQEALEYRAGFTEREDAQVPA